MKIKHKLEIDSLLLEIETLHKIFDANELLKSLCRRQKQHLQQVLQKCSPYQEGVCIFCDTSKDSSHKENCIYKRWIEFSIDI